MNSPSVRPSQNPPNTTGSTSRSSYPFPLQDASLQRGPLRRGSTASSVTSTVPSIAESQPNAISSLLQPPIFRTGLRPADAGFKPPTSRDIPPVTLTNIPHVESKVFQPYLSQIGSLYEAFQRAKNDIDGDNTALFHRDKKEKVEDWETVLSQKLQRPAHSRTGSIASLSSPTEPPSQPRRRPSHQKRHAPTPLSTVPAVYGEEDFHLENPRTFDIVSEHSEIVRDPNAAPSGRKSLATNAILQEKLSWYMDTVEVHLISSISTASQSFFSALGSLKELHDEAEESVARIQSLRRDLAKLDKDLASDGLKVVKLKQRRDNVRRLAEAMFQLEDIVHAVDDCEQMVESGEFDDALDDLDDIERLMAGNEPKRPSRNGRQNTYKAIDLRRMHALQGASDDLNRLRSRAGRGYETRFHNCLLNDMRRHVKETDANATLQRWGVSFNRPKAGQRRAPSTFPSYMNMSADFRSELEHAIQGLARARCTTTAVTSFRAAVLKEMKAMIRRQLPSSNDDDNVSTISASTHGGRGRTQQEKSSILARNIRAMDATDWYSMLVSVYTNVSECLRRLSIQVKILLDVTSTMDQARPDVSKLSLPTDASGHIRTPSTGRHRASSIQAEMQQALDLSSLLGEAVDAVQSQVTKVIKVRSQQNSEMLLEEFVRFVTLNRLFADECEAISGMSGQGLKSVVDSQIRDYVSQFANSKSQNLVGIMDSDKWEAKDFGDQQNLLLQRVMDGSTSDAQSWLQSAQIWLPLPSDILHENGTVQDNDAEVKEKVRLATIDEQKYILPASPIAMLGTIESLQSLTVGIPGMGQELATSLLDCLRQFNSRTSQLILGAGATRTAGLKNITTKHLALSSQGLSFIIALMPYVREFYRRYLPPNTASSTMGEFDKVKRSFQEHQNSIHEKLIDIMSNRASMHVKSLKAINWTEAAQNDLDGVSKYMETLTKETATLQKVLVKHLPEGVVMGIMIPVFDSYKQQLEKAFSDIQVQSEAEKKRMLNDVAHFSSRMGKLEGSGDLGQKVLDVVRNKAIAVPSANGGGSSKLETEPQRASTELAPKAPEDK
ncbi:hypothetical protein LTR05_002434 [Lithohypha guttulata]|uniref:Vacuolar protein sorting-associated protein 54 n=1 Tax=Lithohypha guttulata TaxID=1690604 RepID=A0AAN7T3V3_9EURO|nr:hypothetical protein LTR05_002434 [Lithohypha guttulata]